jgi:hypothetical protein
VVNRTIRRMARRLPAGAGAAAEISSSSAAGASNLIHLLPRRHPGQVGVRDDLVAAATIGGIGPYAGRRRERRLLEKVGDLGIWGNNGPASASGSG